MEGKASCQSELSTRAATNALEGVWKTTVTRGELLAKHPDYQEGDLRADAGRFRLALHGNRFAFWHRSAAGSFSLAGDFRVRGDELRLHLTWAATAA